jgi:Asp-tRNA(Asn)/Glu-tRNA(Gln) amidotransferase C subunit
MLTTLELMKSFIEKFIYFLEVFRELLNLDLLNFKSTDDVVDVNNVREDKNQVEKKFINDQVSQDNQINRNHIIEGHIQKVLLKNVQLFIL